MRLDMRRVLQNRNANCGNAECEILERLPLPQSELEISQFRFPQSLSSLYHSLPNPSRGERPMNSLKRISVSFLVLLSLLCFAISALAQISVPRPSQKASVRSEE